MSDDVTDRPELAGLDPSSVRKVRLGNSLTPGLACFTGVSFFVYLLVKVASGQVAVDASLFTQVAVAAALGGVGGGLLVRARYFYATLETDEGPIRIKGLSKGQQLALASRYGEAAPGGD